MDVPISELSQLVTETLRAIGYTNDSECEIIKDTLLYAELRGNNQGIIKLVSGALSPNKLAGEISVVYETPVSAKIDGAQRCGMVVLSRAVDIAITKAATGCSLIGIVGCSNYSSATGALGNWARKLTDKGLIGIVMSQCPEYVAPYGSCEPIFGTNPLAIGIPTVPRAQVLDMASSAIAYFGVITAQQNGQSLPPGVACDSRGRPTTSPLEALKGALNVFDNNYKGSHIALMIELLAGALTGAAMKDKSTANNWGSLVIAINPLVFGPDTPELFRSRAAELCHRVKRARLIETTYDKDNTDKQSSTNTTTSSSSSTLNSSSSYNESGIFLPGERGDALEAANKLRGSVSVSATSYSLLKAMALGESNIITNQLPPSPPQETASNLSISV